MNILVIGNGFDLAHGLPTKYTDFLEFCKRVFPVYENIEGIGIDLYQKEYLFEWEFNTEIKDLLKDIYKSRKNVIEVDNVVQIQTDYPRLDEIYTLIKDNIWIEYFEQCDMYQKENWIDFESEISEVIQSVDKDLHNHDIDDIIENISSDYLMEYHTRRGTKYVIATQTIRDDLPEKITFKEIRNRFLDDLNRLIRALEIYLCEYIEKIEFKKKSPDIDVLDIDHVLSFNYTHTFLKLYRLVQVDENNVSDPFDYIHGEVSSSRSLEHNNMVLGIDEYLPDDRKNTDTEFIVFKKYYQRIYKGTGCQYKVWVDEIQRNYSIALQNEANFIDMMKAAYNKKDKDEMWNWYMATMINSQNKNEIHNLYIFGHSLDITDRDILRDLILNDNVYTTIFYHSKEAMGQQIANLVKVIGQDELIRRTGGSTKTIEFKLQQPMEIINE